MPTRQGSFRLFRFAGIDVFLHWSWFILALIEVQFRSGQYRSIFWNVLEYLVLFSIVLVHEFGHALACRQVGGTANQIVLWPLGGVAYVSPPQRPGAMLWSIAAGPLVNVALFPLLTAVWMFGISAGWLETQRDLYFFVRTVWMINFGLLLFNLLPIYPLDGGQILRSLLWFFLGRARSLMVSAVVGFIGVGGLVFVALWAGSVWLGILAAFILFNCWRGLMFARALWRVDCAPRREGLACPDCRAAPPVGAFWGCGRCRQAFDTFATQAVCPRCGAQFAVAGCVTCGKTSPLEEWTHPPS